MLHLIHTLVAIVRECQLAIVFLVKVSRPSLVPRPSHTRERGSGVLSDFFCHMRRVSSPIWELESDSRMHNYMCMTLVIVFWTKLEVEKTHLAAHSQLSQETLWPYQAFVNHTVQQSKSSQNSSPGCKMQLWHSLCCRPRPMWQEMLLRTPDPLSLFRKVWGRD